MIERVPPVFFDPGERRWRRFKVLLRVVLGGVSVVLGALVLSILVNPVLPSLGLPPIKVLPQARHLLAPPPSERPLPTFERSFRETRHRLDQIRAARLSPRPAVVEPSPASRRSEITGFYVNWDDTSFTSLKANLSHLDKLVPEWLHLSNIDGDVVPDELTKQHVALAWIRARRPGLRIVPLINNFTSQGLKWESDRLAGMLRRPEARRRAIEQMLAYVLAGSFQGICVDFENIPPGSQGDLGLFMRELYAVFHPKGLEVSQCVAFDDGAFDYRAAALSADELILMAYDEHTGDGEPGPVASQGWFEDALERRTQELPPEKLVVAIGNYGYDWVAGTSTGTEISVQEAVRTAQESEGEIALDENSLNPTYEYVDESERRHVVWFLDAVSSFNQVAEAALRRTKGVALWRLGSEDPSVWTVLASRGRLDRAAAERLRALRYGYDLDYEGTGEVLMVTGVPTDGVRDIEYDEESGVITEEKLVKPASPYVITRRGGGGKRIALTFDDGPDPEFTPRILDILKEENVPATFFVVGLAAELHPRLFSRLVAEGHEVGNHTFTHPNISLVTSGQLRLEVNATERLFESRLGRRSLLFRPPYAEDVEPETPDQVEPLLYTSQRGLFTIGMQIDPDDWKSPGVGAIVAATRRGALHGDGNIVLLHDSGGDRTQTVEALPLIIRALKKDGFELVLVSALMGKTRDEVMPVLPRSERAQLLAGDAGFLLLGGLSFALRALFALGIGLGLARLLFIGTLAVVDKLTPGKPVAPAPGPAPSVAVIVPAFNEGKVIVRTVEALLASEGEPFEILVVDDGSTDDTAARVEERFGAERRVRLIRKPNGGKAAALNHGLRQTQAEIVVALDADTVFQEDTVRLLVAPFVDPDLAAVAGNAKVGNRLNLLTRWQALEYVTSQNLDRRALHVLNGITVVPGAVGAWRRELVLSVGGFPTETLAEDADLTVTLLRRGHHVAYEDRAIAWTEAPDTVRGFLKQRFRWMYGTLQVVFKNRDALFRPREKALGLFALPNLLIFQVLFPLVSPFMDLQMLVSLGVSLWQRSQHPTGSTSGLLDRTLFFYAVFLAVDFLAAALAFTLEREEDARLLVWLLPQRLFYRQLMYAVAVRSMLTAIRGSVVGWGKLERKATVRGSG